MNLKRKLGMKIQKIDLTNYCNLTDDEKLKLRDKAQDLLTKNHTTVEVCDLMCISPNALSEVLTFKYPNRTKIGAKDEAYFSEEEMLNGYVAPEYDELSESEKVIYSMK